MPRATVAGGRFGLEGLAASLRFSRRGAAVLSQAGQGWELRPA